MGHRFVVLARAASAFLASRVIEDNGRFEAKEWRSAICTSNAHVCRKNYRNEKIRVKHSEGEGEVFLRRPLREATTLLPPAVLNAHRTRFNAATTHSPPQRRHCSCRCAVAPQMRQPLISFCGNRIRAHKQRWMNQTTISSGAPKSANDFAEKHCN